MGKEYPQISIFHTYSKEENKMTRFENTKNILKEEIDHIVKDVKKGVFYHVYTIL